MPAAGSWNSGPLPLNLVRSCTLSQSARVKQYAFMTSITSGIPSFCSGRLRYCSLRHRTTRAMDLLYKKNWVVGLWSAITLIARCWPVGGLDGSFELQCVSRTHHSEAISLIQRVRGPRRIVTQLSKNRKLIMRIDDVAGRAICARPYLLLAPLAEGSLRTSTRTQIEHDSPSG